MNIFKGREQFDGYTPKQALDQIGMPLHDHPEMESPWVLYTPKRNGKLKGKRLPFAMLHLPGMDRFVVESVMEEPGDKKYYTLGYRERDGGGGVAIVYTKIDGELYFALVSKFRGLMHGTNFEAPGSFVRTESPADTARLALEEEGGIKQDSAGQFVPTISEHALPGGPVTLHRTLSAANAKMGEGIKYKGFELISNDLVEDPETEDIAAEYPSYYPRHKVYKLGDEARGAITDSLQQNMLGGLRFYHWESASLIRDDLTLAGMEKVIAYNRAPARSEFINSLDALNNADHAAKTAEATIRSLHDYDVALVMNTLLRDANRRIKQQNKRGFWNLSSGERKTMLHLPDGARLQLVGGRRPKLEIVKPSNEENQAVQTLGTNELAAYFTDLYMDHTDESAMRMVRFLTAHGLMDQESHLLQVINTNREASSDELTLLSEADYANIYGGTRRSYRSLPRLVR